MLLHLTILDYSQMIKIRWVQKSLIEGKNSRLWRHVKILLQLIYAFALMIRKVTYSLPPTPPAITLKCNTWGGVVNGTMAK